MLPSLKFAIVHSFLCGDISESRPRVLYLQADCRADEENFHSRQERIATAVALHQTREKFPFIIPQNPIAS